MRRDLETNDEAGAWAHAANWTAAYPADVDEAFSLAAPWHGQSPDEPCGCGHDPACPHL